MSDLDILHALRNVVKDADEGLANCSSGPEFHECLHTLRDDIVRIVNQWQQEADAQFEETAGDFPP